MPIYVSKQTGWFDRISDLPLSDSNLIEVPTMPPGVNYRYESGEWISLSIEEKLESQPSFYSEEIFDFCDLRDSTDLRIGNNFVALSELDLLYYKDVAPKFNDKGVYFDKRGYLIFPQLKIDAGEDKMISFVFYSGNDSRYFAFGFVDAKNFNFTSNDYKKCERVLRFRNQRGCYYQYGRYASGRSGMSFLGYEGYDWGYHYRLDLPVAKEAEAAYLYRLGSGEFDDWKKGELAQEIPVAEVGDMTGQILYPYFGEINSASSPLVGVFLR